MPTQKSDIYETVTNQIVAAIESGVGNWRMPWHTTGTDAFSPINVVSRKAYRGINTLVLWATAQKFGYASGEWGTYKQWSDLGAQVRKGEKSTHVVFWKFGSGKSNEEGEAEGENQGRDRLLFAGGYAVFNASQVDGYTPKEAKVPTHQERIAGADAFFQSISADVRHGGNSAHYSPSDDYIQMPVFEAFKDAVSYYSVFAHEHTHWTGRVDRCDRQFGQRFGDNAYAAEELVAELGAAFVCAHLGLSTEPREDHAKYLQAWLKVLKADKKAVFTAASKAQQAADWLTARAQPSEVAA